MEGIGREWSDTTISQGMSKISGSHRKLRERHRIESSSELPEGKDHVSTLISDFYPLQYENINMHYFKPPGLWWFVHGGRGKLIQWTFEGSKVQDNGVTTQSQSRGLSFNVTCSERLFQTAQSVLSASSFFLMYLSS